MATKKRVKSTANDSVNDTPIDERLRDMYKRWTLDCIVTIAHAVSLDFSARPELYKKLPDTGREIGDDLTELQGRYGFDPNFPNRDIRMMLMKPIFGESDGHGDGNDGSPFQMHRMPVLAAAAGFAEESKATADPFHRERTRSAIVPFRTQMADLQGISLTQTDNRMKSIFAIAEGILRDELVAGVFGVDGRDILEDWPQNTLEPDVTGAKLIEKITTQLPDLPYGVITREMFVRMQRVAEKGSLSIQKILKKFDDTNIDLLITELYAWGSDLGLVGGARPQAAMARPQPQNLRAARPTLTEYRNR